MVKLLRSMSIRQVLGSDLIFRALGSLLDVGLTLVALGLILDLKLKFELSAKFSGFFEQRLTF